MKKIAMFIAAAAIAVSASAKTTVTGHKAGDNLYVGINGGATTALTGETSFKNFQPTFGVRLGKNFTTVFGVALDAELDFNVQKNVTGSKTFIDGLDLDLLGTANLMNLFGGYKGEPRKFEIIALGGFGWAHGFGFGQKANAVTSKVALDFALNLGSQKQWQVYAEPYLRYALETFHVAGDVLLPNVKYDFGGFKYNAARAQVGLKIGVNYKFGNSNGTHNFAIEQLRDQSEIDALNAKINAAQAEAAAAKADAASKDAKIADLQKQLNDCLNKPVVVEKKAANLQPSVVFAQGSSVVQKSQMANVEMIANYMKNNPDAKVKISGYASPEGKAEFNQVLSEKRADAVKNILVKKYKIAADRLVTEGLGATDKLFDEVEFNRVTLFNDTTK